MEIADVWLLLGSQIHQDFLADYPDLVSGLSFIFMNMSDAQRGDLLSFLTQVIDNGPSASELANIWYASGADLFVQESDMPRFFDLMLTELKKAIAASP